MLKQKILGKVFSSGLQAVAVQVLGSLFFYLISVYLPKEGFGVISWMNAVCLVLVTFLGFGLEQVVVRRIAASESSNWAGAAFFAHTIAGFLVTFLALLVVNACIKNPESIYRILPWFFAAQGLMYIGIPLKQFLNAKEKFTPYGVIALISNISKIVILVILRQRHLLNINTIIVVLICTAAFELFSLLIYIKAKTNFSFKLHFKAYGKLLKEASAQYVSVIFDISLSRMDWILLGIMTTNVILADYSFAYRSFELARLPMLIIAPIILPRMARLMASKTKLGTLQQYYINSFSTVELFFAVMIPLALNILWIPLVTLITKGKYGEANAMQFLILSVCIPLQFFVNLLWSISFGAKRYRSVSTITIISAITNIGLNLILIPQLKGLGAAIAFLSTTVLQAYLYYRLVDKQIMKVVVRPIVVFFISAIVIYWITTNIHVHFLIQLVIAVALYIAVGFLSKQLNKQLISNFKHFIYR